MSKERNNSQIVSACGQRLAALKAHVKTKTAVTANGKSIRPADLVATYQHAIDTRAALIKQRAVLAKVLEARDGAEAARLAADTDLRHWVVNTFGENSQEAQEFGFLPPKIGAKTAETKAIAVTKSLATREARGTRGKRQKGKIKGTIVAPAAPADPAVTTPAAAPAASVPASTNGALNGASSANGVAGPH